MFKLPKVKPMYLAAGVGALLLLSKNKSKKKAKAQQAISFPDVPHTDYSDLFESPEYKERRADAEGRKAEAEDFLAHDDEEVAFDVAKQEYVASRFYAQENQALAQRRAELAYEQLGGKDRAKLTDFINEQEREAIEQAGQTALAEEMAPLGH